MKRFVSIASLMVVSVVVCAQDNYYYFHGEKVYLEERPMHKLFVPQADVVANGEASEYAQWFDSVQPLKGSNAWVGVIRQSYKSVADFDEVETYPLYYYKGEPVSVIKKFTVRLKEGVSYQELETLADTYGAEILSPAPYTENQYYIGVGSSGKNSLDLANRFYETGLFEFSEPQFWILDAMQTSDPYWDKQWGLSNTGQEGGTAGIDINVEEAWTVVGNDATVRVAVIDEGVELNHPDLENTLVQGNSVSCGVGGGTLGDDYNHGTLCTGVIAAMADNGIGIAGVASHDSRVVPICAYYCDMHSGMIGYTPATLATAIRLAYRSGGADVISNSWTSNMHIADVENAINEAVINGRGGKGCVVVFAAGNENQSQVTVPLSNTEKVIVVGAVDRCGIRGGTSSNSPRTCDPWNSGGSNYGSELDVVAPGSAVYTTTTGGGYALANGTSLACPHVSGIAALVLSVNPYLTQQEVYGMVNAYAAVQAACQDVKVRNETISTDRTIKSCGNVEFENVIVKAGVKLSIDAPGEVVFGPGFEMEIGAELEMN